MAHNFQNTSFETAGTGPMDPDDWTSSTTATAEEIAEYATAVLTPGNPWENMEVGWRKPLSSSEGDFTLVDSDTLLISVDGAADQTVTFVTADFSDINNATATEVLSRIIADTTDLSGVVVAEVINLVSDTLTAGSSLQVNGGTAQAKLGFSTTVHRQDENSLFSPGFTGVPTDLEDAAYSDPGPNASRFDSFEAEWANLAAGITTQESAPFDITNLNTLLISIDNGATQTVTFDSGDFSDISAATAQEVADAIDSEIGTDGGSLGGAALDIATVSVTDSGQVFIQSKTFGYQSSVRIVGGTATDTEANGGGELGLSPQTSFISGNEAYVSQFSGGATAEFNTTDDSADNFEREWPDNESFAWFGTLPFVQLLTVVSGDVFTLTINGYTYSVTTDSLDSPTSIAGDLETLVTTSSNPVNAVDAGSGKLYVSADTANERLSYSLTVVGTGTVLSNSADLTGPSVDNAVYGSSSDDIDNFESEWSDNGNDISLFSPDIVRINTAVSGDIYSITVNGESYSYTALGGDGTGDIASSLASLINGGSLPVTAAPSGNEITITTSASDAYKITITFGVTGTGVMERFLGGSSGISNATYDSGTPRDEERFELVSAGDVLISFVTAQTGLYELILNAQSFFVDNSGGTLTTTQIRDSFRTKVAAGSITVNAVDGSSSNELLLRSKSIPPEDFGASMIAPGPADQTLTDEVDTTDTWSWSARMHTI